MVNIIVRTNILTNHWANKRIEIICDNLSVVQVINIVRARNTTLPTCGRNLWKFLAALYFTDFIVIHIPGKSNIPADLSQVA